jgi:hypothetical protein
MDLGYRDPKLAHRRSHCARLFPSLIVQLALLGDVLEMEGIRIGLIRRRCSVPEHDYVPALTHCINPFRLRWAALAVRWGRAQRHADNQNDNSKNTHNRLLFPFA